MTVIEGLLIGVIVPLVALIIGLLLRRHIKRRRIVVVSEGQKFELRLPLKPSDEDIHRGLLEAKELPARNRNNIFAGGLFQLKYQMIRNRWLDVGVRLVGTALLTLSILVIFWNSLVNLLVSFVPKEVGNGALSGPTVRARRITLFTGILVVINVVLLIGIVPGIDMPLWVYPIVILTWFAMYIRSPNRWVNSFRAIWKLTLYSRR